MAYGSRPSRAVAWRALPADAAEKVGFTVEVHKPTVLGLTAAAAACPCTGVVPQLAVTFVHGSVEIACKYGPVPVVKSPSYYMRSSTKTLPSKSALVFKTAGSELSCTRGAWSSSDSPSDSPAPSPNSASRATEADSSSGIRPPVSSGAMKSPSESLGPELL